MTWNAIQLAEANGGHWGEHPEHTVSEWRWAVGNGDTRLGYWDWVLSLIAQDDDG
jgi:hypothetical protein